jgi:hypothetical protein
MSTLRGGTDLRWEPRQRYDRQRFNLETPIRTLISSPTGTSFAVCVRNLNNSAVLIVYPNREMMFSIQFGTNDVITREKESKITLSDMDSFDKIANSSIKREEWKAIVL